MVSVLSATRLASLVGDDVHDEPGPVYRSVADRLRLLVLDGRIPDGTRLPSERELAAGLGVSRTTTTRAYAELRDTGLMVSRRGSGSVVRVPLATLGASSLITDPADEGVIALTYAAPSGPPGLARAFDAAGARSAHLLSTSGYLPDGLPALREVLAQRYSDRGLPTSPEQVVVTVGAMGAISLLARTFVSPGSRVVVEGTSYPHAHESFVGAGARLAPLPIGEDPWDPDALAGMLSGARQHVAYLIPEFHNPTGAVMPEAHRAQWAHLLRRHDVLPVVDESLREVNLDGVELPPSLAHHDDRAILVGSASKEFWGGLRVGWIRAPRNLVTTIVQHRMADDLGASAFEQLVLTELLTEGGQTAAAGRARARTARDHLLAELAEHLPEIVVPCPPGGLNLWAELPGPMSSRLTTAAAGKGLLLTPGARFVGGRSALGERRLRLPYTRDLSTLSDAVGRLRLAWDDVAERRPGSRRAESGATLDLIA